MASYCALCGAQVALGVNDRRTAVGSVRYQQSGMTGDGASWFLS